MGIFLSVRSAKGATITCGRGQDALCSDPANPTRTLEFVRLLMNAGSTVVSERKAEAKLKKMPFRAVSVKLRFRYVIPARIPDRTLV